MSCGIKKAPIVQPCRGIQMWVFCLCTVRQRWITQLCWLRGWAVGYREEERVSVSPMPYGAAAPVIFMLTLGPRARCPEPQWDPAHHLQDIQSSPGAPSIFPCPKGPPGSLRVVGSDLSLYLCLQIFIIFLHLDLSGEHW